MKNQLHLFNQKGYVGLFVGAGVGDRVLHEFVPKQFRFNDNISWQNIPLKHVFCPKQSIFTFPSIEQIFKWAHDRDDLQSISICFVSNAKISKLRHPGCNL